MSPDPVPTHSQPFSLQEAMQFEPGTITSEIARLQNSLEHLAKTQSQLEQHAALDPDPDFLEALEDNRGTIAAQTERIGILRQALERKGVASASNPHYDLAPPPQATAALAPVAPVVIPSTNPSTESTTVPESNDDGPSEEGEGVFL